MHYVLGFAAVFVLTHPLTAQPNRRPVHPAGAAAPAVTPEMARKGWDGVVKGGRFEVFSTATGLIAVFPNDLVYAINADSGTIIEANSTILNSVLGQPIGGIIVKGGRNPGGQMRSITESGVSVKSPTRGKGKAFEIPADWMDGGYQIQISYERSGAVVATPSTRNVSTVAASFNLTKSGSAFVMQGRTVAITNSVRAAP